MEDVHVRCYLHHALFCFEMGGKVVHELTGSMLHLLILQERFKKKRSRRRWVRGIIDCAADRPRLMLRFGYDVENIFIYLISKAQLSRTNIFVVMLLVSWAYFLTEFVDSPPLTWSGVSAITRLTGHVIGRSFFHYVENIFIHLISKAQHSRTNTSKVMTPRSCGFFGGSSLDPDTQTYEHDPLHRCESTMVKNFHHK